MGIGLLGDPALIIKRKFRWTMRFERNISTQGQKTIPEAFCKISARPNLSFEPIELNYLNGKNFIPGKGTYETMAVTYIDVANDGALIGLWSWVASVMDYSHPDTLYMGSAQQDYTATGILVLWDGCGNELESWELLNCWPEAIDWGELDMSSNEAAEIALTIRYSSVKYVNGCGAQPSSPSCKSGCGPLASNGGLQGIDVVEGQFSNFV